MHEILDFFEKKELKMNIVFGTKIENIRLF